MTLALLRSPRHVGICAGYWPCLAVSAALSAEGHAADQQSPQGAEIYKQSGCVVCHGGLGTGGFGPKLSGDPMLAISPFVIAQILIGRGQMPPFGDKLSDAADRRRRAIHPHQLGQRLRPRQPGSSRRHAQPDETGVANRDPRLAAAAVSLELRSCLISHHPTIRARGWRTGSLASLAFGGLLGASAMAQNAPSPPTSGPGQCPDADAGRQAVADGRQELRQHALQQPRPDQRRQCRPAQAGLDVLGRRAARPGGGAARRRRHDLRGRALCRRASEPGVRARRRHRRSQMVLCAEAQPRGRRASPAAMW